jgi:signal transduction histidine kinase
LGRYEDDGSTTVLADHSERGAPLPVSTRLPYEAHTVTARVWHRGRSSRRDDAASGTGALTTLARERGLEHAIGAPIVVEGRLWGVINAYWSRAKAPPHNAESRMSEFAELVATAIANANSRDELVRSRARVLDAGDEARRRVVRDLHDGAQQSLVHTILSLNLAERALSDDPNQAKRLLSEAITYAEQAKLELRDLAHGILPSALTEGGLEPGVETLASRLSVPVTVDVATPRLPAGIEASAYFVIAEALTNVVKHSRAHGAQVAVHVKDGQLHIKVSDDGLGGARTDGAGLRGIEDRMVALGGELRVESPQGAGTVIAATLPLPI